VSLLLVFFFSLALILSILFTRLVRNLACSWGWLDRPVLERHVHTTPIPRIGGVAIFASFALVVASAFLAARWLHFSFPVPYDSLLKLLAPALVIFALGLYDDLRRVSPTVKFLVQAIAAVILYFGGFGIHRLDLVAPSHSLQTFIGLPLTIFWVLLITNAFNLIDGLDGLAAGSALFSTVVIFGLSLFAPNFLVSFLAVVLAGVILGFLRYNFHPASIFLGDSGSLFIGFLISVLAIVSSQKAPAIVAVSIPLVSLGFPILDVTLSVVRRFVGGKPIFCGDRDHIHHKLLKRGLSQREAVLLLYAVTAGFGFVSLTLLHHSTAVALILSLTGTAVLIGLQQLRYGEIEEMLSLLQRSTRRRQLIANHVAIRHAAESLENCDEFRSICSILSETLQPAGFDGVRLQMSHPNGFPSSYFLPMRYEPGGKLTFVWTEDDLDTAPWELRLELTTRSNQRWGYLSLIRLSDGKAIALDLNALAGQFPAALSNALDRACARMEARLKSEREQSDHDSKKAAVVSSVG
jgi:UDP-GlcNAc:undecaprenyl-phosphate GlcNAc-1-phosphate transferase